MRQTFQKSERLYGSKLIEYLFINSDSFISSPFKVSYLIDTKKNNSVKILFAVSKKKYKKAVDRNKIKRLLREAYRKNKSILINSVSSKGITFYIILTFIGSEILKYSEIEKKIILILNRLKLINENYKQNINTIN